MRKRASILVMLLATLSPFAEAALPVKEKYTIMPLGDSITEGGGFSVYRYPLMEKLVAAGYPVQYVGSKTTKSKKDSPLGELPHEGYGGSSVGAIAAKFEDLYRQNPADIILLHAGHNQFADQKPIPGMLASTEKIITTARAINPKVTILLAQVIPSGKLPKYSYIPEYNEALVPFAARLTTTDSPVILVNHADGFVWETDCVGDQVHPNASGAEKMANQWFKALEKILPAKENHPASTPAPASSGNSNPIPTPAAVPASTPTPRPVATKGKLPEPSEQLRLWDGPAPGLIENPGPEVQEPHGRVSNVSVPMLDVYLPPPEKANGMAIVICSGGGYAKLASGPIGSGAAARYLPEGTAIFSLKYRIRPPSTNAVKDAVADGKRALQLIRSRAGEWKIDPNKIGMVGFSAGANLILNLATSPDAADPASNDPIAKQSSRPNFIGLCAAWSGGQDFSKFQVDATTPPAYFVHAKDDDAAKFRFVEKAIEVWKQAGRPVELEAYEKGGHMAFNFPQPASAVWPENFMRWVKSLQTASE